MGHQRSQFLLLHLALLAVTVAGVTLARRRVLAAELGGDVTGALLARRGRLPGPPRRLVVVVRAPGLGDRCLSLPLV
jgi:hypothetical protein